MDRKVEGSVKGERVPRVPAKSRLSWQISRLRLAADGSRWYATAAKADRVAVIELPPLTDPRAEEEWIRDIEARFERHAFSVFEGEGAGADASEPEVRSVR